jgi:dephospho-CoA kinase
MLKVALTGSIASGKSTLLRFFEARGIATLDADEIVGGLYKKPGVRRKIIALFHTADRKQIASAVFSSPRKRRELERILHPLVARELKRRLDCFKAEGRSVVVVEVPLLFEAGLQKLFDKVIAVRASKRGQIARLKREGMSEAEALLRISSQLSTREKVKKADFVIDNTGGLPDAIRDAERVLRELYG